MSRYIVILTLAVTAGLSSSEASAQQTNAVPVLALSVIQTAESPLEEIAGMLHFSIENEGGSDLHQQNELEFSSRIYLFGDQQVICKAITFNCHATPDLEGLIAIIAFEASPEAACLPLIGMGFSPAVAEDLVLEAIAIYGVRRY